MHLAIVTILALAAPVAGFTNAIAQQAAASQASPSWFDGLETWHVPTSAVPDSPAVPASSPARDMVFGAPLTFSVFPVNPASDFAVDLVFLDDGGNRVQSLAVGSQTISPSFALPPMKIYEVLWNISKTAVTPFGNGQYGLTFTFQSLKGPNAILSSFVLYSSNPADPAIQPPAPKIPTHNLPRLTPRPLAVQGTSQVSMDLMGTWLFDPAPSESFLGDLHAGVFAGGEGLRAAATNWTNIVVPGEYTLQGFRIASGQPVVYHTQFSIPTEWTNLQMKLRCDGVYSNATVFVNGVFAGNHLGGFTPFELDITGQIGAGPNILTIVVVSASLADTLSR
jgi:beta-galactosidase